MNILLYAILASIFVIEYLANNLKVISKIFILFPELLSAIAIVVILLRAVRSKYIAISPKYVVLIIIFGLHILVGILINTVQPGAIVAGVRTYLKYLPFFLLPAVYEYTDEEIKRLLKLLLVISVAQFPLALYQRIVETGSMTTGDYVRGTLNTSSTLSIYLVCAVTVLLAFYLKKKIQPAVFFIMALIMFIPAGINETKGTIILVPVALMTIIFFMPSTERKFKQVAATLMIGTVLISVFIFTYDIYMKREGTGILDFFTVENRAQEYLAAQTAGIESEKFGRVDAVIYPIKILSDDFTKLFVGLGIGNVSTSFSEKFGGEYLQYNNFVVGSMSRLLWEMGIGGAILYLVFYYFVFSDARGMSARDDLSGTLALGWIAVMAVLTLSLFYNDYLPRNISYLIWFISGYLASKQYRSRQVKT